MISKTKPLRIKQILSKKLEVGTSRIRFNDQTWALLSRPQTTTVTNKLVQQIIKESAFRLIPAKKREYKIYHGKFKRSDVGPRDKIKPTNKLSYLLSRKIVTTKQIWMKKIRSMRAFLKSKKEVLGNKVYRTMRLNAKGNVYRSVKDIESKIE